MDYSKYNLRNEHSLSLSSHQSELPINHNARDSKVLINRGPYYPCHAPDISKDLVDETFLRRTRHHKIYFQNSQSFGRINSEDTKYFMEQKRIVKDYLADMHPLKYDKDIVKRSYCSSRIKPLDNVSDNTKSYSDFIRPTDPERPRTTGFNSGHIRSKLQLNVYGPTDSKNRIKKLMSGQLPETPNVDRFSIFDENPVIIENATLKIGNEESPSKTISTNNSRLSSAKPFVGVNKNVLAGTLGYYGPALTEDERNACSPHHISKEWLKSYFNRVEERKLISEQKLKRKEHTITMKEEEKLFRNSIVEFEQKLSISKINL